MLLNVSKNAARRKTKFALRWSRARNFLRNSNDLVFEETSPLTVRGVDGCTKPSKLKSMPWKKYPQDWLVITVITRYF